jgi:hypothetical protein
MNWDPQNLGLGLCNRLAGREGALALVKPLQPQIHSMLTRHPTLLRRIVAQMRHLSFC